LKCIFVLKICHPKGNNKIYIHSKNIGLIAEINYFVKIYVFIRAAIYCSRGCVIFQKKDFQFSNRIKTLFQKTKNK